MEEKKVVKKKQVKDKPLKVKFTPKKDREMEKLKKDLNLPIDSKPDSELSGEAEAMAEIEEGFPDTVKNQPSKKSTAVLQDKVGSGDITPTEAKKKAGIGKGRKLTPPQKTDKELMKESQPKKKEAKKKKVKAKKITMDDGHTYTSEDKDAECINCKLKRNNTTTMCFKQPLFPVTLAKFLNDTVDYVDNIWRIKG